MKTHSKIPHFAWHMFPHLTYHVAQSLITCSNMIKNALKWGLLGRGFADHDNLLAKFEKASSQVLTADLKQTTILWYVFFSRTNKVLNIVLINKYSYIIDSYFITFFNLGFFVD